MNTWSCAFDCRGGGEVQLLKYEQYLEDLGVKVLRYDVWNPSLQFNVADIVHYFSVQGGSWRFLDYVRNVKRIPLVISPIVWIDKKENYYLDEIKFMLNLADKVLPNSHAECAQLSKLLDINGERFATIVNGVDEIFFEPVDSSIFRNKFNLHDPFVLCVGNIEERKNQLRLIRAIEHTNIHLVIAGNIRDAEYARKCFASANRYVHFVGYLPYGSLLQRSAYAAADVFCLPSYLETPGLAAIEAAALGSRLVLTNVGCTEEYFGDRAIYCDPYNIQSIRDAIQIALHKIKDADLSYYIRDRYTWKHAAVQLINVYKTILGDSICHNMSSTGEKD